MFPLHPLLLGFLVALGVGLLIGIDCKRKKGEGLARHAAGLRTFTLAAPLGAVAIATGGELLLAAATLGVVAFAGLSYWRHQHGNPEGPLSSAGLFRRGGVAASAGFASLSVIPILAAITRAGAFAAGPVRF